MKQLIKVRSVKDGSTLVDGNNICSGCVEFKSNENNDEIISIHNTILSEDRLILYIIYIILGIFNNPVQ